MKLYHGSNMTVENPVIKEKQRALDFGAGFYLTSDYAQAKRWATSVTRRRRSGEPVVNVYEFDENKKNEVDLLVFETAGSDWLEFVVANRKEIPLEKKYDIVRGPVANDSTITVIDDYMDGKYSKDEAVKRLLPQQLTDQYAFLTKRALTLLQFKGVNTGE